MKSECSLFRLILLLLLLLLPVVWGNADWVNVNFKTAAPGSLLDQQKVWHHPGLLNQNLWIVSSGDIHTCQVLRNAALEYNPLKPVWIRLILWQHWDHTTSQYYVSTSQSPNTRWVSTGNIFFVLPSFHYLPFSESPGLCSLTLSLFDWVLVILIMVIVIILIIMMMMTMMMISVASSVCDLRDTL